MVIQQAPKNCIKKVLLERKHYESININIRKVILIKIQSTMDLIFNEEMVGRICKSKKNIRLRSNVGKVVIDHKAVVAGYIKDVWFEKTDSTNIFSFKNPIQKYRVT